MIKAFLRKILPHKIWQKIATFKNLYITKFSTKSYAQEGEDLILSEIFASHTKGFYVDIGAHHPFRFSNTYLFYKKGWRGINVDAMPGSMKLFNTFRSRDINIECGIAKKLHKNTLGGGAMTYYSFSEPALNTFSSTLAKAYQQNSTLLDTIQIQVQSLEQILDSALPKNTHIDFLSIDVEGLDREVLESNNWDKYQPKVILIESPEKSLESLVQNPIYQFLKALDYELYAKSMRTLIFKKSINTTSDRLKVS